MVVAIDGAAMAIDNLSCTEQGMMDGKYIGLGVALGAAFGAAFENVAVGVASALASRWSWASEVSAQRAAGRLKGQA
jgi:hypothetical protein